MDRVRRATPAVGVGAVLVTFGTMGLAIVVSPSFAWTGNALSNLGHAGHPAGTATTELLFNGGLILGGVAGVAFAVGVALVDDHAVRRLGVAVFGLSMLAMGGVGLFPQDGPYHFEVAVSFYTLFSVATIVYGAGQVLDGAGRDGTVSIALGAANLGVWVVWGATGPVTRPGLAVPEILGAGLVAVWTVLTARRLWQDRGTADGAGDR